MTQTIRLSANELTNVDVSHVSLVKRGANRLPFRVLKSQEGSDMKEGQANLDLGTLFKKEKPNKPARVEALIVKSDIADKTVAFLKSKDIEVFGVQKDEENGASILSLVKDADLNDVAVIKSDDSSALAVSEVKKSMVGYMGAENFLTNVTSGSFFPHMDFAAMALTETVYNIMAKEDSKEAVVNQINESMNQFNSYVQGLVTALPSEVFSIAETMKGLDDFEYEAESESTEKSESGEGTEAAKSDDKGEAEKAKSESEGESAEGAEGEEGKAKSDDETGEGEGEGAEKTPAAKSEEGGEEPTGDAPAENQTQLLTSIRDMITTSIQGLEERFDQKLQKMESDQNTHVGELKESVTKATTDAAKALEVLGVEVVGGTTSKSDKDLEKGANKGEKTPTQEKMPSNVERY